MSFVGTQMRAGLQALEYTVPIFWSNVVMSAFAFAFAFPMAKWLGLRGALLGLLFTQVIYQGIVGVSLVVKSNQTARMAGKA